MRLLSALAALWTLVACSPPPKQVSSVPPELELVGLLHDSDALNRAHDVEVQGDIAFVPGKGGSLALIDIADPANPRLLSSINDAELIEDAETVLPLGDVLLLGSRDFHALDVSDPTAPQVLKTIRQRPGIDRINGMAKAGDYVFTANKSGFVGVFDVSDPRDPQLIEAVDLRPFGQQSPHDIAATEDLLLVVSSSRETSASFRIYRALSDGLPLPGSEWEALGALPAATTSADDIGGTNRVAVSGRTAFVGAFVGDRVAAIDFADPAAPRQLWNMPVCDIDATGLTVVGDVVFAAGGECVEAVDVSDPAHPVSIARFRGGDLFPTRRLAFRDAFRYDNAHDLVYRDGLLYVTAQNDNRFGILGVGPRLRALVGE